MNFFSAVVVITELLMLAMLVHVLLYKGFNKMQKAWFIATFASIMFCSAAEFAVHCGFYHPALKVPLIILTVLQFSIAPVMAMLFAGALGLKKQWKIAIGFFGINLLVEAVMAIFGKVFFFSDVASQEGNVIINLGYNRGPLFYVYTIFYVISLIYLFVALILVGRLFRHRDAVTIVLVAVVLVGGVIPMAIFKINVAYLAIGIAASLCYIFYNDLVQQDTKDDLVENQRKLSEIQEHIISGMASLIESRDTDTGEHVSRTSKYVKIIAEEARKNDIYTDIITDRFIFLLYTLAPMHDVGKILVSDQILKQPRKLTPEEYEIMKTHARDGGMVVKKVLEGITDKEYIDFACDIATYHHEWWNGKGYPSGLKEEEIPLSARIMAIADVFDALISKRCYKEAIPIDESFDIIESQSGTHFDPQLVEIFLKNKEKFREISKTEIE